jgi:hypothetical protein
MKDTSMPTGSAAAPPPRRRTVVRSFIEIGFIMFLFYSNLLMGELTRSGEKTRTFGIAIRDIFTPENFAIGLLAALIGYLIVEFLRRKF